LAKKQQTIPNFTLSLIQTVVLVNIFIGSEINSLR